MVARKKRCSGAVLAEATASIALILPVMIVIIFTIVEVSQAYMIKEILSQAAREAARGLSIAYGDNPDVARNRSLQDSAVFDHVRIAGVVVDDRQFSTPVFTTDGDPPSVAVTVTYTSGSYGLSTFPNPDPLNLRDSIVLSATSTYRLE